jgi:hypothetical protein
MAYQNPEKPVHFSGDQNKTPAPTRAPKDFGSARGAYGANQFGGRSSVNPGESVTSPLADELKRAGTDGVLDQVIKRGTARDDSGFQTRAETSKRVPSHPDMRDANSGGAPAGKVPSKCGCQD